MRLFSSSRWSCCLRVCCVALVLAQRKEPLMEHPTFYRTIQIDGLSIFYREKRARKTRRRFFYCTDFRLHRGCSSRSSHGFPIVTTLSPRLPRLRTQRLARPEKVRVYV